MGPGLSIRHRTARTARHAVRGGNTMTLIPSGSQTVGPFFNFGLTTDPELGILARDGAEGERVRLEFRILDGDGAPTPGDAMIELWQADAQGRYTEADPRF